MAETDCIENSSVSKLGKIKSWLLIFILSILPGFIFMWDWNPEGEVEFRTSQLQQSWFQKMENVAEKFSRSTEFNFWYKLLSDRFAQIFSMRYNSGNSVENSFKRAFNSYCPKGFPRANAVVFYRDGNSWKTSYYGDKLNKSDYLMRNLFKTMVANAEGKNDLLNSEKWSQRIRLMFGHLNYPELFRQNYRNIPFPAIVDGKPCTMLWNFVGPEAHNKVTGGYFFYFPRSYSEALLPLDLIMQRWRFVCNKKGVYPVLLPVKPETGQIKIHPEIDNPELRQKIEKFASTYIKKVKSPVPELSFKTRLPAEISGSAFEVGNYIARICALTSESGHIGLVLEQKPEPDKPFRESLAYLYFLVAGILWGMFVLRSLIFFEVPSMSLRFKVVAWFLAFAAFPAGLTISAWTSLLQDFENYRISQLQKGLYMSALNIEAGLSKIDSIFFNASSEAVKSAKFYKQVFELPQNPDIEDDFFASIYESYKNNGVDLSAVTVLIQGGWFFTSSFQKDISGYEASMLSNAIAAIMHQFLYDADKKLYEKYRVPPSYMGKKVPSLLNLNELDVEDNIYSLRRMFDRCSSFKAENGNFLQYLHQVDIGNSPFAIVLAYWNWVPRAEKRFKLLLNTESIRFKNSWGLVPDFAVFKQTRQGVRPVISSGNFKGMLEIAKYPVNKITNFKDKDYVSVMLPSSRLPDYRYVARASNIDIRMRVEKEKALISVSVCALMLLIGLGASAASWWVISPVNSLSLSLKQLEQGNKPIIKELMREDELGIAASSLRRMTGWILQREKLVRFISPKVLEIVAGGNPFKAGAGSLQEVTVLVSDIRSFTTLSEEQPPEEIFRMLNFHLARMSEKIIAHSGVIDRYVGDAIWAVFYDKHPDGGEQALKAAVEMMKLHQFIQDQRLKQGKFAYGIGIGLVRGKVLAGVMGEESVRLDFTIVGEALTRAENLEALSKLGKKTGIVFGPEIVECARRQNIAFEKLADHEDVLEVARLE